MRPGPPPKPTRLKILAGNPGKRPLNVHEPQPEVATPECPRHLNREARAEWARIAPELIALGVLARVDRAALAGYCDAWAEWVKARRKLDRMGLTFSTPNGYVQQRPEVAIAHKALDQMRAFLVEFGMTPSARSRINVRPREKPKDAERFFA